MTKDTQPPTSRGNHHPESLPREPTSSAELLSATHLFIVETVDLSPGQWSRGADQLEHRSLALRFRLLERFKGEIAVEPGDTFDLKVEQRRENELTVSDFHGFWSHTEPAKGSRYLVMAEGTGGDAAALMQEPAVKALMDATVAVDVKAAMAAEQRFGAILRAPADPAARRAAALGLLTWTHERRAACGGLFGRYLWTRVAPAEAALLPAVLEIVQARDAARDLREALIYGLYDEVLSGDPAPESSIGLLRVLFGLALQPDAAPLMDRLVQVPIYNLVFRPGDAVPAPIAVIPDAAERAAIGAVLARYQSERARRVAQWLAGGEPPK